MEEANDLATLQKLITRLGVKDDRRQSPRYKVEIMGNYHIDQARHRICQGRCWLVDISKGGLAVKMNDTAVKEGMILHLQFLMAKKIVDITSRVVHIEKIENDYLVGVESLSELDDIVAQLFPQ
jgi:c-di-GMP-binding flagellar brake protein YcgR